MTEKTIPEILIPAEKVPVKITADICVIGGSCTGVFAAVRAARLGKKVVLLERTGKFGGVATLDFVGIWHSLYDFEGKRQIIGGLTGEVLEQLEKRNARKGEQNGWSAINTEELTLVLDDLAAAEKNISVLLHTSYLSPVMSDDGRKVQAVVLFNKSGRFAVRADFFIDASGDGLLCRDAGVPMWTSQFPQPPTACCRLANAGVLRNAKDLKEMIERNRNEFPDLPGGYSWGMDIPGSSLYMLAGTRVLNCRCEDADEITRAELESRRQIRAMIDMVRKEAPDSNLSLQGLPSEIGIREGLHIQSLARAEGDALLFRLTPAEETIGCGTYPVDIHHTDSDRIEFFQLSGIHDVYRSHVLETRSRWLPEGETLSYYRIPMKAMIPVKIENLIAAGRMIDADRKAFGALRVMVNLNQCGEAAGVAASLCLDRGRAAQKTDIAEVRAELNRGGSLLPD